MREEGNKIRMKIKLVEQSWVSVTLLIRADISGCLFPDCEIEEDGANHSRWGANYTGECRGETRAGAHTRICQHQAEIRGIVTAKSMASHLSGEHPEHRHS